MSKPKKRIAINLRVSGEELSEWLDVGTQTLSDMKQNGYVTPDAGNLYDLKSEVVKYIGRLRARRESDVDAETAYNRKIQETGNRRTKRQGAAFGVSDAKNGWIPPDKIDQK